MRIDDSIDVDATVNNGDYEPMKTVDYLDDNQPSKKAQKRRNVWKWLKFPIYVAFGFGAAFLLFRSYGIYQQFFASAGLRTIGGVCTALKPFPFAGWLLQAGCDTISQVIVATIALITLIALTILMSIPLMLFFDPGAIEGMIHQLRDNKRDHQPISVSSGDDEQVRVLAQRYQSLPKGALRTLNVLSVAAFVLEAFIVYSVRGKDTSIIVVLIDSIGFELLLTAFFMFRNAFLSKPKTVRVID